MANRQDVYDTRLIVDRIEHAIVPQYECARDCLLPALYGSLSNVALGQGFRWLGTGAASSPCQGPQVLYGLHVQSGERTHPCSFPRWRSFSKGSLHGPLLILPSVITRFAGDRDRLRDFWMHKIASVRFTGLLGSERCRVVPSPVLIDFIVGSNLEQENIVFWLTCTFDEIKDDAEVVFDTARPGTC
jgi:hypothetical protein